MISYREYRQGRAVVRTLFVLWALVLIAAAATIFLPFTAHAQDSGFYARITYTASGGTTFTIPFPYIASTGINVYDNGALKVSGTDYTFPDVSHVQFTSAPTTGHTIQIYRWTSIVNSEATFHGGPIASIDLNRNDLQKLYGLQEAHDRQGTVTNITAGTGLTLTPNPITVTGTISLSPASGSIGGVIASTAPSHQYATGVTSGSGAMTYAQPSVADLSEGTSGTGAVARVGSPTFTGTLTAATVSASSVAASALTAPNFTNSIAGLVPTGGSNTTFLRGDGSWQSPSGNGTVTSVTCGSGLSGGTFTASGTCSLTSPIANSFISGNYTGFTGITSSGGIALNNSPGNIGVLFQTGAVNRWLIDKEDTESGSNSGSDLYLRRYSDAGAAIDFPLVVFRSSGQFIFNDGIAFGNNGTTNREQFTLGNTAVVSGSVTQIDARFTDGVNTIASLGGVWPTSKTYAALGVEKTFNSSYSGSGTPAAAHWVAAWNNGSGNDVVGQEITCINQIIGGNCYGMNIVLGDSGGLSSQKSIGLEIDLENSAGVTNGNGVVVNGFNLNYGNAIAVEGASSGSFQNGLNLAGPGASYTNVQILGFGFNVDPSGVFNHTSDMRLKNVIRPITSAVDDLSKIRTFYYTCKTSDEISSTLSKECGVQGHRYLGLAAQDVQKIYPELISTAKDDEGTLAVNYAGMVPALIEAVRELRADNEALRLELNTFKRGVHGGRRFATKR